MNCKHFHSSAVCDERLTALVEENVARNCILTEKLCRFLLLIRVSIFLNEELYLVCKNLRKSWFDLLMWSISKWRYNYINTLLDDVKEERTLYEMSDVG